ncbi:F420-non-reducing hydrogenase subunit G [Dissulfurispira thermophila]|uniref:F420-non-reducing hydrogenase subunit G n=2 Tax=root TaxID=1 RepID=A0A7G1GXW2_9BACT|nr:NADH:ubiquinone oxidoreductase [Dissulfurispira thermophila]BCB95205.1 F420-non-reducing hydrogenase subunit G [Dissulfurispira thermophila]
MLEKPKLSLYWAASCGGCEIAVTNLNEKILDVDANFDFMFCPCLLDTKYKDIEAMPDKSILITLFNGAIRTKENEEIAHLLRKKSRILIAFGSCSYEGCIPGLANLHTKEDILKTVYFDNPSIDNPSKIIPQPETNMPEGVLHIPDFYEDVKTLAQVTDVDYFIPGCPPEPEQIWNVISAVVEILKTGAALPSKGAVLGAGKSSVCDECERKKEDKKIKAFKRTYEFIPDKEQCLLEQGIICMGIATRDGCGALCPKVNMPCTGCYGPPEGVFDQGAKMVAALGSIIDIGEVKGLSEDEINKRIDAIIDTIPDFAGTFYKYSLPGSILKGRVR